jgi:hypothetical protein
MTGCSLGSLCCKSDPCRYHYHGFEQMSYADESGDASRLREQNDRLRAALAPFAEAGRMSIVSGRPPGEHVDADAFVRAKDLLEELQ